MSFPHLHLLLNHFPVIGLLIGIGILTTALLRRNSELSRFSLGLFVALGIVSLFVFFTGEPAEEAIEKLPGFSESITERHEEVALFATIAMGALGGFAIGILAWFRKKDIPRWITMGTLFLAVANGALMGYTAFLGGQVRHTEIRSSAVGSSSQENPD